MKHNSLKPLGCSKSCSERKVYSNTGLLQKQEKSQINNLLLHLKELENEEQIQPQTSRSKEMTKIRAEINDIQTKKQ